MTPHRARLLGTTEPLVVLDVIAVAPVAGIMLLTVDTNGTYLLRELADVVCAEPAFLGQVDPPHEHELGPSVPIIEGSRVKGTRRTCACGYFEDSAPRRSER